MGESERVSAGATRTRMREILNYRCECEKGIRCESYSNEGEHVMKYPQSTHPGILGWNFLKAHA